MKSEKKEFELGDNDFGISVDVNEAAGTFSVVSGTAMEIDGSLFRETYQFRLRDEGKADVRLIDKVWTDVFAKELFHPVRNGTIDRSEFYNWYRNENELKETKIREAEVSTEWHEEKNFGILLCLYHGNKLGLASVRTEIARLQNNLKNASQKIIADLEKIGAIVDLSQGSVLFKNRSEIAIELDKYLSKDAHALGLHSWANFYNHPGLLQFYAKMLNEGPRLTFSDVWTDEILLKETSDGISVAFPEQAKNYGLEILDGKYLRALAMKWGPTALTEVNVREAWRIFEKYRTFISDVDYALTDGCRIQPNTEFAYPFNVNVESLERVSGQYLKERHWQNDYFDWILIGAFVQREALIFARQVGSKVSQMGFFEKRKYKEGLTATGDLVLRLSRLSQISAAKTYSVSEFQHFCREIQSAHGFVHPCVATLLENRINSGKSVLTFPEEARVPEQMEALCTNLKKTA